MAARYVHITEEDVRQFLEPKGFTVNEDARGNELVFDAEHDHGDAIIRIYSSVKKSGFGAGAGRGKGKDAIRVVLLARVKGNSSLTSLKPVFKAKRVHRVQNWRENLRSRMNEVFDQVHEDACPACGAIRVRREGKHGTFYSCANWPECKGKSDDVQTARPNERTVRPVQVSGHGEREADGGVRVGEQGRSRAGALGVAGSGARDASPNRGDGRRMKIRRVKKKGLTYNEQQKSVIDFDDGKCLVSAGPGSGKTRVITTRIVRLIRVDGIDPESIFATTFTKKAADEMNARLKKDGIDTDKMSVSTMHSFCYKVMRESKRWPEWEIDDKDRYNLLIKQATGWKGMKWRGVDITLVGDFISLAKNSLLRPDQTHGWDVLNGEPFFGDRRFPQAYFETEELRRQRKLITFDDMLIDGVEVLETDEALCAKYQNMFGFVIVDEFQDSNIAQLRLMELMAAPQWNLMCVGDVDQAIYEWRGAKPSFMVDFAETYDARIISMGVNYRCAPNIMDMAARCIEHNSARITKELSANKTVNASILCREMMDLDAEAEVVADEVEQLRESNTPLGEMFVLYRTNAQSRAVEEVFCRRKIPHVVLGGASFYQRKEVQDLISYLRVMINPKDIKAGLRAINRPFRYVGKALLEQIEETAVGKDWSFTDACSHVMRATRNRGIGEFLDVMDDLDAHCQDELMDRPGDLLSIIVKKTGYLEYLASNEGSDTAENSRVANVGEVIRSADRFESVKDFLQFVDWQIAQRKKRKKNKDAVQCMTIHKAKGLEASAVFLIGVNEGILPHAKCTEECEEERRLYYVGVTRAMDYLHVSCVQNLGMDSRGSLEPSRFISESGLTIETLTAASGSDMDPDSAGGQHDEDSE